MLRTALVATTALAAVVLPSPPAAAGAASALTIQSTVGSRNCGETPARARRRGILGGIGGALAGRVLGSNDVTRTVNGFIPAQQMLTDAFIDLLDCDEQQKAARATEQATVQAERGGAGTTVAWTSESRPGVTGSSTVTAVDNPGVDARRCMTVSDVVIIDGEETRQPKRMCRTPPSTRYARV